MNRKHRLFSTKQLKFQFSSILALSFVLAFGGEGLTALVSQTIIGGLYYPFFKIESYVEKLQTSSAEIDQLRLSVVEASIALSMLEEAGRENERLRSVLGFELSPGYSLLPAKVISVRSGRLPISAIINRGASDSILVDQPVINQQGLIGRIESVAEDFAVVQLLTDPVNRVAARVADSREMGIVRYDVTDGLLLDNFPIQGSARVGDIIVSSGLGGVYAPGLTVGTVTEIVRPEDEPFCIIKMTPAANFHSIEELFVLRTADID
jgi:rod shape-determining protein MreC